MDRRDLFRAGLLASSAFVYGARRAGASQIVVNPLTPPAKGEIPVAFRFPTAP